MNILINIICGYNTYEEWCDVYRIMQPVSPWIDEEDSYSPTEWEYPDSNMNGDIKQGYTYNPCCNTNTYYNDELIRDIQHMYLYRYIKELYVKNGYKIEITMSCNDKYFMTDDIENKLKQLCEELFGINDCIVVKDTIDN